MILTTFLTHSPPRCFQFTWVGIAEDGNQTDFQSCADYEDDVSISSVCSKIKIHIIFIAIQFPTLFDRQVPCFSPLVWTYNDENGLNSPDINEIVNECERTGCNPFCARGGGMCTKYTVTDRNKERTVRWESHFCGQGIKWDGDGVSRGRCFSEKNIAGQL